VTLEEKWQSGQSVYFFLQRSKKESITNDRADDQEKVDSFKSNNLAKSSTPKLPKDSSTADSCVF